MSCLPPQTEQIINRPRFVVAGAGSHAGKTTVTLGLMAALRRKGFTVQGFKAGPDYIDPSYHAAVTGRPSRNLDTWMMGQDAVREVFQRGSAEADLSIIGGMNAYEARPAYQDNWTSVVGSQRFF